MKLLLDQNLSPGLCRILAQTFPGISHVGFHGLSRANDLEIWEYARAHPFILVSKDSDFSDLSVLRGAPPKVVWLRLGNCTSAEVAAALEDHAVDIAALDASQSNHLLILP